MRSLASCGTQNANITTGGYNGASYATTYKFYGELPFDIKTIIKGLTYVNDASSSSGTLNINTFNEKCDMMIDFISDSNTGLTSEERRDIIALNYLDSLDGKWSVAPVLPEPRSQVAGSGIPNSALIFGGYNGINIGTTSVFDGLTWSNVGTGIPIARYSLSGFGIRYASVCAGGVDNKSYNFDGLTWVLSGNLSYSPEGLSGVGILNAGIVFGGYDGGMVSTTNTYNGSVWSVGNNKLVALEYSGGCGTRYNAISIGGNPVGPSGSDVEIYNGLIWSYAPSYNITTSCASGMVNSALIFGGTSITEALVTTSGYFNGYTWVTSAGLTTPRVTLAGAGSASSAISFGGTATGTTPVDVTEKYLTQKSLPTGANLYFNIR